MSKTAERQSEAASEVNPEVLSKLLKLRSHLRENFGKIVMGLMTLPRYRHQTIGDLQHLVLEPLIRDRVAMAYPKDQSDTVPNDVVGVAIWASVSEEVDQNIQDQIRAGVFPIRLKPDDWQSGEINWLLDVFAPNQKLTADVIANFRQVIKEGQLRLHPVVNRLVDKETLEALGAYRMSQEADASGV